MGRHYAGILGLLAFLTVLVRGILHGGDAQTTVLAAVLSMFGFAAIGFVAGSIAETTVRDAIRSKIAGELEGRETVKK